MHVSLIHGVGSLPSPRRSTQMCNERYGAKSFLFNQNEQHDSPLSASASLPLFLRLLAKLAGLEYIFQGMSNIKSTACPFWTSCFPTSSKQWLRIIQALLSRVIPVSNGPKSSKHCSTVWSTAATWRVQSTDDLFDGNRQRPSQPHHDFFHGNSPVKPNHQTGHVFRRGGRVCLGPRTRRPRTPSCSQRWSPGRRAKTRTRRPGKLRGGELLCPEADRTSVTFVFNDTCPANLLMRSGVTSPQMLPGIIYA